MDRKDRLRAVRSIVIELIVYGIFVTIYTAGVLSFLADPLAKLYQNQLGIYAWVSLVLIVVQGVVLEDVTSFLLDRLRIARFD